MSHFYGVFLSVLLVYFSVWDFICFFHWICNDNWLYF